MKIAAAESSIYWPLRTSRSRRGRASQCAGRTALIVLLLGMAILPACGNSAPHKNSTAAAAATTQSTVAATAPADTPTETLAATQTPAPTEASAPSPAAAAIATLTVLPTPQATPGVTNAVQCGAYLVTQYVTNVLDTGRVTRVSVTDAQGKEVKQLVADTSQGAMVGITRVRCGELTGDGVPELTVETFTGGADCCMVYDVVALTDGAPSLLHWDARKGGIKDFELLTGTPPYQIVGVDDRLADLELVPSYATPELPVVFTLRDGRYVRDTLGYPQVLRANLADAQQTISTCEQDENCERGQAVRAYAIGHWLGEDDATLAKLKTLASPAVYTWLEGVRSKVDPALTR